MFIFGLFIGVLIAFFIVFALIYWSDFFGGLAQRFIDWIERG